MHDSQSLNKVWGNANHARFSKTDLFDLTFLLHINVLLQAVYMKVKNILMALSSMMSETPVACVTATEGRWSAVRCPVKPSAATLTDLPGNAVESVTVRMV